VQAKFANIGGLKVRAPIKSAGVVVGRVSTSRFDNESYEALVTSTWTRITGFPKDTSAKDPDLRACSASSTWGLEAGGDGVMLKEGDRLAADAIGGGAGEPDQPVSCSTRRLKAKDSKDGK
jgi:phospholipid/cholesterol/gamma-HCH transport system substrate-binding protein